MLDDRSRPARDALVFPSPDHEAAATRPTDVLHNLAKPGCVSEVKEATQKSKPLEVFTTTNAQKVSFAIGDMVVVAGGQKKFDFAQINKAEKHPSYGFMLKVVYHKKNEQNLLQAMVNPMYRKSGKPWMNNIKMDSIIMNLKDQTRITKDIEKKIFDLLFDIFSSDEDST